MKKTIAVTIILFMTCAISLFAATISDPNNKISFTMPENWSKDKKESVTGVSISSNHSSDTSAANIQVDISNGEGVTIETIAPELVKQYAAMDKSAKVIEKKYITLNGEKAYVIIITMNSEGMPLKIKTVAIIKNNSFCNIVYTATLDAFDANDPALQTVLKTLTWK